MPFGFHGLDLVAILAIALLIFGPKKLPEMGKAVGQSISAFKKGMSEITSPKEEKPETYDAVPQEVPSMTYSAETVHEIRETPVSELHSTETSK
jgi:sec-independent protein translocase protein TatA